MSFGTLCSNIWGRGICKSVQSRTTGWTPGGETFLRTQGPQEGRLCQECRCSPHPLALCGQSFPSSLSPTATFSLSRLFHLCVLTTILCWFCPSSHLSWFCCPSSASAQWACTLAFIMIPVYLITVPEPPLSMPFCLPRSKSLESFLTLFCLSHPTFK